MDGQAWEHIGAKAWTLVIDAGPAGADVGVGDSLAGRGEQTKRGHVGQRSGDARTATATLLGVSGRSLHAATRMLTLRHGESEWNALGRWQGQEDPPLTQVGLLQAVAAGEQLGAFDAIWVSFDDYAGQLSLEHPLLVAAMLGG